MSKGLSQECWSSNVECVLIQDKPTCISCKEEAAATKRKEENQ